MNHSDIRTRYAPSPTGYLHVGGLRTALYNYLFARHHSGKLILRVEDTDRTRLVEGAVENFIDVFHWLGIEFDESPKIGGPYGPYVQSERLDLYSVKIRELAASGFAYPCFCSSETLDKMRADQEALKRPPMYDKRCRKLSKSEADEKIASGAPHVWRMKVPDHETIHIHDLIRGDVQFESHTIDDQVLLKSDGYPTYHLANVVDDHEMRISHVIRGEEWLPSTPKHVLLYRFFGWEPPQFAHLPLLLNPDRSKMSKRSGDVAVEAYREKGILPETLLNFVALLGWHPQDEREFFTLEELVREFSLERVNKAGAVFDMQKLRWMNGEYIAKKSSDEIWESVCALLPEELESVATERVRFAVESLRAGAETYADIRDKVIEAYSVQGDIPEFSEQHTSFLNSTLEGVAHIETPLWNRFEEIGAKFKEIANASGKANALQGKQLWMTLRLALTGREHGPELAKLVAMWGREETMNRLSAALSARTASERTS
jgi:glutamyl-tRNA synthetase